MNEIRRCGADWRYCDGQCGECELSKVTYTNKTDSEEDNDV